MAVAAEAVTPLEEFERRRLFLRRGFFSPEECRALRAKIAAERSIPAPVGKFVEGAPAEQVVREDLRRSRVALMPDEFTAAVMKRIAPLVPEIASHYGEELVGAQEPQFLVYGPGDHFPAHEDLYDDPIFDQTSRRRRVSVLIFLSQWCAAPADCEDDEHFCGGLFNFHRSSTPGDCWSLASEPGLLLAFRSAMTHEVTKITAGQRFSIATWLLGPRLPEPARPE